nr:serine hydrolase-like protein [Maniola hyperantus]
MSKFTKPEREITITAPWGNIAAVVIVQEHFKWDKFAFIGHSLGCSIGKHFNLAYPGRLTCLVELDPTPPYLTVAPLDFAAWYKEAYGDHYTDEGYRKHTRGKESAPKYTYEQAKEMLKKAQDLTDEAVEYHLERFLEPVGDGIYR